MTATAHALIGASLAVKLTNPFIGIPIAILSHFLADLVPHWDAGTNRRKKTIQRLRMEAAADVLLGFGAAFLIFSTIVDPDISFDSFLLSIGNKDCVAVFYFFEMITNQVVFNFISCRFCMYMIGSSHIRIFVCKFG